jgi:TolB-like protein
MRVVFGPFELDLDGCELTRGGRPVALERRPTEVLCLLARRPGELVSRRELATRIWGAASGVDADMGINTAIRKIRLALGDVPSAIRHVETVQGRGYRFIAPVAAAADQRRAVTIAVLPFDAVSASSEHAYIADGFTEEMISTIGLVAPESVAVIGRRSVMAFRGSPELPADIARALGATHLLDSTLRIAGGRLRITTRLLRADGRQDWSAAFDGTLDHLLSFQQQVSTAVAAQIRARLAPGATGAPANRHTGNEAAFDLYLRGRHCWRQNQSAANQQAIAYFAAATDSAPGYALAWSGLADTYSSSPVNADVPAAAIWGRARHAAEMALEAGPELAEAHASMGFVRFWLDWDWIRAERDFQRAAALDPGYAFAFRMIGVVSSHLGWHAAAAASLRRAVELDPLFAMHHALSAVAAFHAGAFEAAAGFARQAIMIEERFWIGHYQLAQALEQCGTEADTLQALDHATALCGNSSKPAMLRGWVLARCGRSAEARAQLEALTAASGARFVPPYAIALIHLGLGEVDLALAALERALLVRDVNLAFLPCDPKWAAVRQDARFADLIRRCGFFAPPPADLPTGGHISLQMVFSPPPWSRSAGQT